MSIIFGKTAPIGEVYLNAVCHARTHHAPLNIVDLSTGDPIFSTRTCLAISECPEEVRQEVMSRGKEFN